MNILRENLKFYLSSDNRSRKLLLIGINRLSNKFDDFGTESRRDRFHSKSMESKMELAVCRGDSMILAFCMGSAASGQKLCHIDRVISIIITGIYWPCQDFPIFWRVIQLFCITLSISHSPRPLAAGPIQMYESFGNFIMPRYVSEFALCLTCHGMPTRNFWVDNVSFRIRIIRIFFLT